MSEPPTLEVTKDAIIALLVKHHAIGAREAVERLIAAAEERGHARAQQEPNPLDQLLMDYRQIVEVEDEAQRDWNWLDEIEASIGCDRYIEIMSGKAQRPLGER